MAEADYSSETCEDCSFLAPDDTCSNSESVYYRRPVVYRDDDGTAQQAAWCDRWHPGSSS